MAKWEKTDVELLKKLVSIHASWDEIEDMIGLSRRTLERHFAQVIDEARSNGKISLRRKQFEIAMQGNVVMLKWLGQQILGQSEKSQIAVETMTPAQLEALLDKLIGILQSDPTREKRLIP